MPLTKKQKGVIVENISDTLSENKVFIYTYFSKISVEKIRALRKNLKEKGIGYKIIKKSLLKTALGKAKIDMGDIDVKQGQGAVGVAFAKDDQLSPAKIIYSFSKVKDNETFKVLGGIFDKQAIGIEKIAQLAKVNSREDLLAGFLRQINAPLSKLVYAVQAIADKKNNTSLN